MSIHSLCLSRIILDIPITLQNTAFAIGPILCGACSGYAWSVKAYHQGEKAAGCHLGILYAYGLGIERSFQEALKYYREASEDNYPLAQVLLGLWYFIGIEGAIDIDVEQGYALFQKAAVVSEKYQDYTYEGLIGFVECLSDSGEISASLMVAIVHQEGLLGISQDEANAAKALQYYEKAVKIANNVNSKWLLSSITWIK